MAPCRRYYEIENFYSRPNELENFQCLLNLQTFVQELGEAKIKRDEVQNKRKDLWRQDSNFEQSLNTSKEQLDEAERQLRSTVSKVSQCNKNLVESL